MKKHSLAEFFKSKSFYVLLGVGALAIIAITVVSLNQPSGNSGKQNLADLNEPNTNVADNGSLGATDIPDNTTPSDTAKNEPGSSTGGTKEAQVTPSNPDGTGKDLEGADVTDDPNYKNAEAEKQASEKTNQTADTGKSKQEETAKAADDTKEVMTADSLYFDTAKGLNWPINGDVLLNYSPDRVIYFKTLEQFRCNPALVIQAKVGAEVANAATGIITSITKEDETGVTVKVNVGSGYSLVYGQLEDNLKVKVGDMVQKGELLGKVAKPTMYYSLEGGNLYFMVEKDKETIDPMSLLKK
ncbi:Peptidase family M23 [Anaerocolumna jejuensis DSM 15929]|uniref:Peptidase family M23 n=1 Tax=Anaerocolumna jejuensis DSM 15929 TaxID=1121322 RepID=A0A1M6S250_9FIRM|nr:peptidoglycan DD-metalloendopeptidase family protein [Anaerocolumna jejuensis]SHK38617.1 Peptidase family M23 [Anaerocolumna jejuensis DSM 15929]